VPLLEGERLQLHDQPQQPGLKLLRSLALRGINHPVIDRGQRGGFGDPASRQRTSDRAPTC
jgi:hypothetical protein